MSTWTPLQLQCLEALKVPVMAFVTPKADSQPAAKQPAAAAAPNKELESTASYFYRLGPWLFQSSTQLPVTGISWINDLAAYADTRLSQISQVADAFNIEPYLQNSLTPEQKRELWEALKARLKHRKDTTDAEQATQDKPKPQ